MLAAWSPNLMQANADVTDKSHVVTIDEAHVFSSNLTNEFIFAIGSGALQTLSPAEISYANGPANPFNSIFSEYGHGDGGNTGILGLNIFNYGPLFNQPSVGYDEYFLASNNSRQFSDNLNWIRGRHSMTFGFIYLRKGGRGFRQCPLRSFWLRAHALRILRRRSAAVHGEPGGRRRRFRRSLTGLAFRDPSALQLQLGRAVRPGTERRSSLTTRATSTTR